MAPVSQGYGEAVVLIIVVRGPPVQNAFVGRVLFNPPLHARWRVKENPPYASCNPIGQPGVALAHRYRRAIA